MRSFCFSGGRRIADGGHYCHPLHPFRMVSLVEPLNPLIALGRMNPTPTIRNHSGFAADYRPWTVDGFKQRAICRIS